MDKNFILKIFVALLACFFTLLIFSPTQPPPFTTEAWGTPQTNGVYGQLLPAPQWLYAGDTARCVWEVHPNTTKTINSVSYGTVGNWTSCTQNTTDNLLWNCSSVTVANGNVSCPGMRVVQNENPGTSETLFSQNLSFKAASVKGSKFPGCSSADCTISSGGAIASGNYFMRNLNIQAALTLSGNVNITVTENFTMTSGSITYGTGVRLNISAYNIGGTGTINGANGGDTAYLYLSGKTVNLTGITLTFNGASGGTGGSSCPCCGPGGYASPGGNGGNGGIIVIYAAPSNVYLGSINANGGNGGQGGACCAYPAWAAVGGNGGNGGNLTIVALNGSTTSILYFNGGNGGQGGSSGCPAGYGVSCANGGNAGNGGKSYWTLYGNITVNQSAQASAGSAGPAGNGAPWTTCAAGAAGTTGLWNISYCGNGTGMDWTKFTPTAVNQTVSCRIPPTSTFVVPNTSTNMYAYLQNLSINATQGTNISLVISYSKDNGSTWEWLSPDFYSIPYNSSNNNTPLLDTHRQGTESISRNLTTTKTCYNSSSQNNTCINATNIIGDGVNWLLIEPNAVPFNGSANITNSLFGQANVLTIRSYAGYYFTAGTHVARFEYYNYTSAAWVNPANLSNNAFGWINVTGLPADIAQNNVVQVRYRHPDAGNPAHTGIRVDYLDASVIENWARIRVIPYNITSSLFGAPTTVIFNLSNIPTTITGTAAPNGSVTTNAIKFTCNFTNGTTALEAATPNLILDGTSYPLTFNTTDKTYYTTNNVTLFSGAHWWQCSISKANYKPALSTNVSFNLSGFGIFYPSGQSSVKFFCPFPTISGMTPVGQKAGIGIFRIQNNNQTGLKNYSFALNETAPSGTAIYSRCDQFTPTLGGWTQLQVGTGFKGLLNINSTNASAYCWLRMDCAGAVPGVYNLNYNITEE